MSVAFYLGDPEGDPPHWGGVPRRCSVLRRPRLSNGTRAWWVTVDPPLPGLSGEEIREVLITERLTGFSLEDLADGSAPVYIATVEGSHAEDENLADDVVELLDWGQVARLPKFIPRAIDYQQEWQTTLRRIRQFISKHGHSHIPAPYYDDEGRLDVIVGNIRQHHAGGAGVSPGPFPGVDYAVDLNRLEGWEW